MNDALWAVAERLWQPWLAIAVLGIAAIVTLATGFVQLRGLPTAIKEALAARRDHDSTVGASVAAVCGIASLGAGALAIEIAGPGALVWMWIVVLLAMAVRVAEATLVTGATTPAKVELSPGLRRAWWLAALVAAAATIGVLQGRETGALLEHAWGTAPLAAAICFAIVALPFATLPVARRILLATVPWAILATVVALGILVMGDSLVLSFAIGDAWNQAFGVGQAATGATAGGVAIALAEGARAATIGGGVLHGAASPEHRRASMIAPLVGIGVIATIGALVAMTEPARASITEPDMVPLERPHSRGLRPAALGQTVVLPADTTLADGEHYGFVVRGNPRGVNLGKLDLERNLVLLPAWSISGETHEVVFRSKDKEKAKLASWDVRVPCTREIVQARGGDALKLTPVNPDLQFKQLIAYYELDRQPYVPLGDYHFVGKVAKAESPDKALGVHLAMFEPDRADRENAPELHEFFRAGYRGPYADTGEERAPWGFVGVEGFSAQPGTRLDLRLPANPRGEPFVRLDRTGGVEGPAWPFLMQVRELVVQHETDPEQDIIVPVKVELDGFRTRFRPDNADWTDFRKLGKMDGYRKVPFVRVGDVDFPAEVHGDARLETRFKGRVAIVPLFEPTEPQGPHGEFLPYPPHPGELVAMGMHGPVIARDGSARIGGRMIDEAPSWARMLGVLALFLLGLASVAAWPVLLHRDGGMQRMIGIALAIAAAVGGACTWTLAYGIASVGAALAVLVGGIAVLAKLGAIRRE
ncbi:MAG TPA: hypothetical protein VG755_05700 [Nannocystaceae bacterium]|nr:hypothetical protein [Nannocystaceae bacterium]